MNKINVLFILLASWLNLQGQETIVKDRPDQTEASITIPHRSFQIETGFGFNFTNEMTSFSAPNTLFRYGLFPFLELRLFNEVLVEKHINSKKNSGISDLQVGVKVQLFKKEDNKTSVAFLSHLITASGSNQLSNHAWGNTSRLLITHQINDKTALGYNIGYSYLNSTKGNLVLTLSCAQAVTSKFGIFAEVYGDWIEFDKAIVNGDAGFTYLIKPNLQLDASYGLGFNQRMNFASLGVSWNIAPSPKVVSPTND